MTDVSDEKHNNGDQMYRVTSDAIEEEEIEVHTPDSISVTAGRMFSVLELILPTIGSNTMMMTHLLH
jgi:hypothetical protein